jgi:hypothetical protein
MDRAKAAQVGADLETVIALVEVELAKRIRRDLGGYPELSWTSIDPRPGLRLAVHPLS